MGEISVEQLLARLRTMDRRVLGLIVGGFVLFLYLAVIGVQYWGEVGRYRAMLAQQTDLIRTIDAADRLAAPPEAELQAAEARLAEAMQQYAYENKDWIIPAVAEVASDSRVNMSSISSASAGTYSNSGTTYEVQRVTVSVDGSLTNILGFMENMAAAFAMAPVSLSLNGLEGSPSANLQMNLYINPSG